MTTRRAYFGYAQQKTGVTCSIIIVASDAVSAFLQLQKDVDDTIGKDASITKFEFIEELPEVE